MAVAVPFTTAGELEMVLSTQGVDLRTLDPPDGLIEYAIDYGTSMVRMKIVNQATAAQLAVSPFVRLAATIAAAVFLTSHGGEPVPASVAALWDRVDASLDAIFEGKAVVPDLVLPGDYGTGPTAVNIRVDLQRARIVRRVAASSMDTPAGYSPPTDYVGLYRYFGWD